MKNNISFNIQSTTAEVHGISLESLPRESTEINTNSTSLTDMPQNTDLDYDIIQSTSINMEYPRVAEGGDVANPLSSSTYTRRNLLTLFREARNQFGINSSYANTEPERPQNQLNDHVVQTTHGGDGYINYNQNEQNPELHANIHSHNTRSWRMNLNNVLSFSTPSPEAIRSLITSSSTFRYSPRNTTTEHHHHRRQETVEDAFHTNNSPYNIVSRNNLHSNENDLEIGSEMPSAGLDLNNHINSGAVNRNQTNLALPLEALHLVEEGSASAPNPNGNQNTDHGNTIQDDEDNNVISDIFIKVLSHFMRYLPFICIIFVKFMHDHFFGIVHLVALHGIMYQVNRSLRDQIAKFSQKSYSILFRDFGLVSLMILYRFLVASSSPDPFGLLLPPPANQVTLELTADADTSNAEDKLKFVLRNILEKINAVKDQHTASLDNTVTITKSISIGLLIYYIAVNDLVLKLITIMIKISITLMPARVIRHKPRARMYAVVEYISQFYRSLVPLKQWLIFLFESYSGVDVISGIIFSSFYIGAKGFEVVERVKPLKKALVIFLHNMDHERKPTKDELKTAGSVCPICHDSYSTPIVLECRHIFCDECVSTWFKREQTCPMCRAKVSEDPTWQDGATTFFFQLC